MHWLDEWETRRRNQKEEEEEVRKEWQVRMMWKRQQQKVWDQRRKPMKPIKQWISQFWKAEDELPAAVVVDA